MFPSLKWATLASTAVQKFVQMLMQAIAVYFVFIPMHRREASPVQPAFSMFFPDRPDVSFKDVTHLPSLGLPPAGVRFTLLTPPPWPYCRHPVITNRTDKIRPGMVPLPL